MYNSIYSINFNYLVLIGVGRRSQIRAATEKSYNQYRGSNAPAPLLSMHILKSSGEDYSIEYDSFRSIAPHILAVGVLSSCPDL